MIMRKSTGITSWNVNAFLIEAWKWKRPALRLQTDALAAANAGKFAPLTRLYLENRTALWAAAVMNAEIVLQPVR